MKKPIIGVTPLWDEEKNSYWMLPGYLEGLEEAGAIPVILPLAADGADIAQLADLCDGFLFTGGQDVAPQLYGEAMKPTCGELCPARDTLEQELLNRALEQDKPILGICRGIQILNVALGGTLIQHVPDAGVSPHTLLMYPRERASHAVRVQPDSLLARILGTESLGVNSFHHMAVKTCAPALRVTARADDGITEAVELLDNPEGRFFLAVQWHPEMMAWADGQAQALLDAFVASCRETLSRPDFRLDPLI